LHLLCRIARGRVGGEDVDALPPFQATCEDYEAMGLGKWDDPKPEEFGTGPLGVFPCDSRGVTTIVVNAIAFTSSPESNSLVAPGLDRTDRMMES